MSSTLNIGEKNQIITENAIEKSLRKDLKLLLSKQNNKSMEYLDFLKNFSLHDLRHSKI